MTTSSPNSSTARYDEVLKQLAPIEQGWAYLSVYRDKDFRRLRVGRAFAVDGVVFVVLRDSRGYLYIAQRQEGPDRPRAYFSVVDLVVPLERIEPSLPRIDRYLKRYSIALDGRRMRSAIALDFRALAEACLAWDRRGGS